MTEKAISAVNVRVPTELKWRIAAAAAENRRSINAEILYRLEAIFGSTATAEDRELWVL